MADKDLSSKILEDYTDVFADIYNTLLFKEEYLKPEMLKAGPTESVYKADSQELHDQRRDVLKKYSNRANLVISTFGIENQADIDKTMPIRIMNYDAATYRQQITDGEKAFTPVITIVLNMADKPWNAAKSIHELTKVDDKLSQYVQDYQIRVFDIAFLEDEVINSFQSDFRAVATFFKKKRIG